LQSMKAFSNVSSQLLDGWIGNAKNGYPYHCKSRSISDMSWDFLNVLRLSCYARCSSKLNSIGQFSESRSRFLGVKNPDQLTQSFSVLVPKNITVTI
jgi:hypothetical protein